MRIAKYLITFNDGSTTTETATSEQNAARHAVETAHVSESAVSNVTELRVMQDTTWEHD